MLNVPFDPTVYGPAVAALLAKPRLASLGPGVQEADVQAKLNRFDPQVAFGQPVRDLDAARACLAALWLYFDYLDESHGISQDLNTPEGSCWHAIMHRREPDAWNSRYWWRQVWNHPVITQLISEAPTLGYDYTTPADFVDFCERVRGSGRNDETLAKQVQLLEWQILFDFCARKAVG